MRKFIISFLLLALVLFAFSSNISFAKVLEEKEGDVLIAEGEIVDDDLFIGAQNVTVDGTVNGDVFIGAQTVNIGGVINGNLHVGAQNLYLTGDVTGNIYTGVQNLGVTGSMIGGSLLAGAQNVSIDENSQVGGSILTGAASFNLDSPVGRNVMVAAGSLSIGSNARIGRDLYYTASEEKGKINIADSKIVAGQIHGSQFKAPKKPDVDTQKTKEAFAAFNFFGSVISYLGALVVGYIWLRFFGRHLEHSASLVSKNFWKSFGWGFLITIAFIPGFILLLITGIGIPVAGISLLILLLFIYLAKITVGAAFGNYLATRFNWRMSAFWTFATGLAVIYLLKLVPVIGFFTGLVVLWSGLGALTLSFFQKSK